MRRRATRRQFLQQAGTLAAATAFGAGTLPRVAAAQSRVTLPFAAVLPVLPAAETVAPETASPASVTCTVSL